MTYIPHRPISLQLDLPNRFFARFPDLDFVNGQSLGWSTNPKPDASGNIPNTPYSLALDKLFDEASKDDTLDGAFETFVQKSTYCRLVGRDTFTELTVADQPTTRTSRVQIINDDLFTHPKQSRLTDMAAPVVPDVFPKGSVLLTLPNGERAPLRNSEFLVLWEGITLHPYEGLYPFPVVSDLLIQLPREVLDHDRHLYYTVTILKNAYDCDGHHRARTTVYVRRTKEDYDADIMEGWKVHEERDVARD